MKKLKSIFAFMLCAVVLAVGISCNKTGSELKAEFNDDKISSIEIGDMIDFTEFVDYTSGASVTVTVVTPSSEEERFDSMYFQTEQLGKHEFTLKFSLGGKSKTLKCDINVVPPAPTVVEPDSSVYYTTGETINFNALIIRSGIRITPSMYSDVKFKKVEYADEVISVENYSKRIETHEFAANETSYTFEKSGSYVFYIEVSNVSGIVNAKISVSVLDAAGDYPIANVTSNGVIYGENDAVKIMQGSASELSYIASDTRFDVAVGEYLKTELEFKGKNAPQILFFADTVNGETSLGKGVAVSLETTNPATAMSVYGPDRFTASKALVTRNTSFGRESLNGDKYYKWQVIITRISDKKLAVKSLLFVLENGEYEEAGRFDWASFEYSHESSGYVEYMGSYKYGEVIFRYSEPKKCDKDGKAL